jgi:hypothetical protein
VPRARRKARVAQAFQQPVRPGQRVLRPELLLQDPHDVSAAQRADAAVGRRGPGVQPRHQLRLARARQPGRAALATDRLDGVDPAAAAGVGPVLDATPGAAECLGDLDGLLALQSEHDRPVAVAAQGVPLDGCPMRQLLKVPRLSFGDPQSNLPVNGGGIMPSPPRRREGLRARIKTNPYQISFMLEQRALISRV